MEDSKPTPTSLSTTLGLLDRDSPSIEDEKKLMSKVPSTSAIGSLMYTMVATRPDLAYAIGVVSRYMSNLDESTRRL